MVLDTIDLTLDTTDEEEQHTKSGLTTKPSAFPSKSALDLADHAPAPSTDVTQSVTTPEKNVIPPPRRPRRITPINTSSPLALPQDAAGITVSVSAPVFPSRPSSVDSTRTLSTSDDQPLISTSPEPLPASPPIPVLRSSPVPADVAAYPSPTSEAQAEVEAKAEAEAEDETVVPSIDIDDDEDLYSSYQTTNLIAPAPTPTTTHPPAPYTARPITLNDVPSHLSAGIKFLQHQHQTIELVEISHAEVQALALRSSAPAPAPIHISPFQHTANDSDFDIWPANAKAPVVVGDLTSKFFERMVEWTARTERRKLEAAVNEGNVKVVPGAGESGSGSEMVVALPVVADGTSLEGRDGVSSATLAGEVVLEVSATLPVEALNTVSDSAPAVDAVSEAAPVIFVETDVTSLDEVPSTTSAVDEVCLESSTMLPHVSVSLDTVSVSAPAVEVTQDVVSEATPAISIETNVTFLDEVSSTISAVDDVGLESPATLPVVPVSLAIDTVSIPAPAVEVAHDVVSEVISVETGVTVFDEVSSDDVSLELSTTLPIVPVSLDTVSISAPAVEVAQDVVSEAIPANYVVTPESELGTLEVTTSRLAFVVNMEPTSAPVSSETHDVAVIPKTSDTPPIIALVVNWTHNDNLDTEVNPPLPAEDSTSMLESLDTVDWGQIDVTSEFEWPASVVASPRPFEASDTQDSIDLDIDSGSVLAKAKASAAKLAVEMGSESIPFS